MSTYTDAELKTIMNAPMTVGMAIAMVDMGIVSTAIEAAAMSKEFLGASQKFPANSIIQSVFSEEAMKSGRVKPEKPEITPEEVKSGALVDKSLASVTDALALVEAKATPAEVQEYKQFIYDCANAVANAAGSGLFGSGTPKVSEGEAAALARLKTALGI